MCGIAGFSGLNVPFLAEALALGIETRGRHAHGWIVQSDGETRVGRRLGPWTSESCDLLVGDTVSMHSRYATCGGETDIRCAHPFTVGGIVGMHNGMLYGWDSDYPVDSMQALESIGKTGGLGDLEGYGTFVWVENDITYMVRACNSADLEIWRVTDGKQSGIVFASTSQILKDACEACGLKKETSYKVEVGVVHEVHGGKVYDTGRELRFADRPVAPWQSRTLAWAMQDWEKEDEIEWERHMKDSRKVRAIEETTVDDMWRDLARESAYQAE